MLLKVTGNWKRAIDEGKFVAVALLDLKKAFDSVNHQRMLDILQSEVGVGPTTKKWFESYLCRRTQVVTVNGKTSRPAEVTSRVPQGSVLGPIMFTIYINGLLQQPNNPDCTTECFAHVTAVYAIGASAEEAAEKLTDQLQTTTNWFRYSFLELNAKK